MKKDEVVKLLKDVCDYYVKTRQKHHTTVMIKGVSRSNEKNVCLMVASRKHGQLLSQKINTTSVPRVRPVSILVDFDLEMRGKSYPLAWDNYTIHALFQHVLNVIDKEDRMTEDKKEVSSEINFEDRLEELADSLRGVADMTPKRLRARVNLIFLYLDPTHCKPDPVTEEIWYPSPIEAWVKLWDVATACFTQWPIQPPCVASLASFIGYMLTDFNYNNLEVGFVRIQPDLDF